MAITRAVYKCYISKSLAAYYKDSSLVPFISSLKGARSSLICFENSPAIPEKYYYSKTNEWIPTNNKKVVNFSLSELNWRKISFTSLSPTHTAEPKTNTNSHSDKYDNFVFKQLVKGNKTGNLLHFILENIDFTNNRYWEYTINNALKRFMPKHQKEYAPMLLQLLNHLINVNINVSGEQFALADIRQEKRLNELEFDFNVPVFNPADIAELEENERRLNVKYNLHLPEGIMNGKMDMFFEHSGKYYILDWKSNFLGDSLDYYKKEVLTGAMSENNYHLQYLLYTVASKNIWKAGYLNSIMRLTSGERFIYL
ncbi:MAG: hypothetical protein WKG06_37930 [Segetibacter sp.]